MALKDTINNAKYADDIVISLPDGTTGTLGELRALDAEQRASLLSRQQTLDQAEQTLAARIHEAAQRGILNPQPLLTPDQDRRIAAAEYGLDENDPLLGRIVKEMKTQREELTKAMNEQAAKHAAELQKIAGVTAKVTQAYLAKEYQTNFKDAVKSLPADIAKKVSLEDAIKYAESNKLMDSLGAYDITAAVDRLTWNDMKEYERAEVKKSAAADAQKAADMARVMPQSNRSGVRTVDKDAFDPTIKDGDRTRTKSLDEVLAEAANDQSLWFTAAGGALPN